MKQPITTHILSTDDIFFASYCTVGRGRKHGLLDVVLHGESAVSLVAGEDIRKYPRTYYQHPYATFDSRLTTEPYIHLLINTKKMTAETFISECELEYDKTEEVPITEDALGKIIAFCDEYTRHHRKCPLVEYDDNDNLYRNGLSIIPAPKEWEMDKWR